ncbi:hypothetical protein PsYK624_098610 [Phanerochaete sordida]|uniref:Uncharacterized protein n=1 Tax=Phanerochaete sordida TaxID=48140 RepID=A0A9P3LFW8_9APHY|nr:hypothetical protein PsYK624_098610 [Phanerochaete sordida]
MTSDFIYHARRGIISPTAPVPPSSRAQYASTHASDIRARARRARAAAVCGASAGPLRPPGRRGQRRLDERPGPGTLAQSSLDTGDSAHGLRRAAGPAQARTGRAARLEWTAISPEARCVRGVVAWVVGDAVCCDTRSVQVRVVD